jgi:cellulose biosynthesis protein BcsQ
VTPIVAFFNNKGGVGKTSLVFHLAWMYADAGLRVLAVDLDPQANLTGMFLSEDDLERIWPDPPGERLSILGVVQPLISRTGDIGAPSIQTWDDGIGLLAGDLGLSRFEDVLADAWPRCFSGDEGAFRVMTAFHRTVVCAADQFDADLALVDVGPNLGAINRAALITASHFAVPLGPDLFSRQGLRNLGPTISKWGDDWRTMRDRAPSEALSPDDLPAGTIRPVGYIFMRHSIRRDRPMQAYARWMQQMPREYAHAVLDEAAETGGTRSFEEDPNCLALLRDYRSLMPMAQEAHKPMFKLTPADGAFGGHQSSVVACYGDFRELAVAIGDRIDLAVPTL